MKRIQALCQCEWSTNSIIKVGQAKSSKSFFHACFTTSVAAKFVAFVLKRDANWENTTLWQSPGGVPKPIFFYGFLRVMTGFLRVFCCLGKPGFSARAGFLRISTGSPRLRMGFLRVGIFWPQKLFFLKHVEKAAVIHQQPHKTMNWVCIITRAKPIQESLRGKKMQGYTWHLIMMTFLWIYIRNRLVALRDIRRSIHKVPLDQALVLGGCPINTESNNELPWG